jgi:sRNA-binding protein
MKTSSETLSLLRSLFPESVGTHKPLKVGIHRDIETKIPALSPKEIGAALDLHVNSTDYHREVARSMSRRLDLDGTPGDFVSTEDRMVSAAQLNDRAAADMLAGIALLRKDLRRMAKQARILDAAMAAALVPRVLAAGDDGTTGECVIS